MAGVNEKDECRRLLLDGIAALQLDLSQQQCDQLIAYLDLLI